MLVFISWIQTLIFNTVRTCSGACQWVPWTHMLCKHESGTHYSELSQALEHLILYIRGGQTTAPEPHVASVWVKYAFQGYKSFYWNSCVGARDCMCKVVCGHPCSVYSFIIFLEAVSFVFNSFSWCGQSKVCKEDLFRLQGLWSFFFWPCN